MEDLIEARMYLEFIECQDDNLDLILEEMQNCRRLIRQEQDESSVLKKANMSLSPSGVNKAQD